MLAGLYAGRRGALGSRLALVGAALAGAGAVALTAGCYQPGTTGMRMSTRTPRSGAAVAGRDPRHSRNPEECRHDGERLLRRPCVVKPVDLPAEAVLPAVPVEQPDPAGQLLLYRLRTCETGGNYGMHTSVGGVEYGGAYGFNVAVWRAQGHSPDPEHASPALQDSVELADIGQLGVRRSNPGCAAKLGL